MPRLLWTFSCRQQMKKCIIWNRYFPWFGFFSQFTPRHYGGWFKAGSIWPNILPFSLFCDWKSNDTAFFIQHSIVLIQPFFSPFIVRVCEWFKWQSVNTLVRFSWSEKKHFQKNTIEISKDPETTKNTQTSIGQWTKSIDRSVESERQLVCEYQPWKMSRKYCVIGRYLVEMLVF